MFLKWVGCGGIQVHLARDGAKAKGNTDSNNKDCVLLLRDFIISLRKYENKQYKVPYVDVRQQISEGWTWRGHLEWASFLKNQVLILTLRGGEK